MAYDKPFYSRLRKDRDDAARAKAFDEAFVNFSEPQKAYCELALGKLIKCWGLGEQQAKALLSFTICFVHMKPDEQDRWIARGIALRAASEWEEVLHKKEEATL